MNKISINTLNKNLKQVQKITLPPRSLPIITIAWHRVGKTTYGINNYLKIKYVIAYLLIYLMFLFYSHYQTIPLLFLSYLHSLICYHTFVTSICGIGLFGVSWFWGSGSWGSFCRIPNWFCLIIALIAQLEHLHEVQTNLHDN